MYKNNFNKYKIGWSKLTEFIFKGQRAQAFGIYRLLAHTLKDQALAFQLEGDIHLSFGDSAQALNCYLQSLDSYKAQGKHIEAIAINNCINYIKR